MEQKGTRCSEELKKQGYTVPEYMFIINWNDFQSVQSKILEIKGWLDLRFPGWIGKKVSLIFPNGEIMDVKMKKERMTVRNVPIGYAEVIFLWD